MKIILYLFLFIVGMAVLLRLFAPMVLPGIRVTSWYRTPEKNRSVGGALRSAHLLGWGLDFVPVNTVLENLARRFFPFVLNEGDHIHIGWY